MPLSGTGSASRLRLDSTELDSKYGPGSVSRRSTRITEHLGDSWLGEKERERERERDRLDLHILSRSVSDRDQALDKLAHEKMRRLEEDYLRRIQDLQGENTKLQHKCEDLADRADEAFALAKTAEQEALRRHQKEESLHQEVSQIRKMTEVEVKRTHDQLQQMEEKLYKEVEKSNKLEDKLIENSREYESRAESEFVKHGQSDQMRRASEAELSILHNEVDKLRDERANNETERRQLRRNVEDLREQLSLLHTEKATERLATERTVEDLQKQVTHLTKDKSTLQKKIKDYKKKSGVFDAAIESDLRRVQRQADEALMNERRIAQADLEAERAKHCAEVSSLQRQLQILEERGRREAQTPPADKAKYDKDIERLERELQDFYANKDTAVKKMTERLEEERLLLEKQQTRATKLQQDLDEERLQAEKQRSRVSKLSMELEEAKYQQERDRERAARQLGEEKEHTARVDARCSKIEKLLEDEQLVVEMQKSKLLKQDKHLQECEHELSLLRTESQKGDFAKMVGTEKDEEIMRLRHQLQEAKNQVHEERDDKLRRLRNETEEHRAEANRKVLQCREKDEEIIHLRHQLQELKAHISEETDDKVRRLRHEKEEEVALLKQQLKDAQFEDRDGQLKRFREEAEQCRLDANRKAMLYRERGDEITHLKQILEDRSIAVRASEESQHALEMRIRARLEGERQEMKKSSEDTEKLAKDLREAEKALRDTESVLDDERRRGVSMVQEAEVLKRDNDGLRRELHDRMAAHQQEMENLSQKLSIANEEASRGNHLERELQRERAEKDDKLRGMLNEKDDERRRLRNEADEEIYSLKRTFEGERSSLKATLEDTERQLARLRVEKEVKDSEFEALHLKHSKLQGKIERSEEDAKTAREEQQRVVSESQEQVTRMKSEIDELQKRMEKYTGNTEDSEKKIAELRAQNADLTTEAEDLRRGVSKAQHSVIEAENWKAEVERLHKRLQGLPLSPEEWSGERAALHRRFRELQKYHDDELKRSDAIHARQCNDLVQNLEACRKQRDTQVEELSILQNRCGMEAERGRAEGMNEAQRWQSTATQAMDEAARLKEMLDKKTLEHREFREDAERAYRCEAQKDEEMVKGFEDLRRARSEAVRKEEAYREQLKQATIDFRGLEEHVEQVEDEHKRVCGFYNDSQKGYQAVMTDLQNQILDLQSNLTRRRTGDTSAFNPIIHELGTIQQKISQYMRPRSRPYVPPPTKQPIRPGTSPRRPRSPRSSPLHLPRDY